MSLDAIVVGAGPNGLAAAITLARAGRSVRVYESRADVGGSCSSAELTEPGVIHDVCATVQSLALASPFLRTLHLAEHGFQFAHPDAPFAHPLDDGTAVVVQRSVQATAQTLGAHDAKAYNALLAPMVENADDLMRAILGPLGLRHPLLMARFGRHAIRSANGLASTFHDARTRALIAGVAAHSMMPLDQLGTAGFTLALTVAAHAVGWPVARSGAQRLSDAMAAALRALGGEIVTGAHIASLRDLPPARAILCDVTPRQFLALAAPRVPAFYGWRLGRYRYGPGVFRMDWTLNAPVPWQATECRSAGTLHLGGGAAEIAASEDAVNRGRTAARPYVLAVQASQFDPTRAPAGKHTLWAYCHVPNGSTIDMTDRIESQLERFAPGFRDCISSRHVMSPADLERRNPNLVGGDIGAGAATPTQILTRPVVSFHPYATPIDNVYLCSAATPPGIGVHGMCGFFAAMSALKRSLT